MFLYFVFFVVFIGLYVMYIKTAAKSSPLVPTIPNALPAYGFGLLFADPKVIFDILVRIGEFTNRNGGIGKFSYGPVVAYVISSADEASIVLNQCMKKMFVYDLIKPYVGSELVAASVPVWKKNRRISDLAFKQPIIDNYVDTFNQQASKLADNLTTKLGKYVDLSDVITRAVLEIVCQTTMGLKMDGESLISDEYAKAIDKVLHVITNRFQKPWLFPDFIFNLSNLKMEQDEALDVIWNLSNKMVELRKKEYLERLQNKDTSKLKDSKLKSYLDILIENTVTEDSSQLSDLKIRQLVDNIILAGFDTTTVELLFILVCIGSYPDVQDRLYHEIKAVLDNEDRYVTKIDMQNLIYLDAVIKESLRLYPIGPVIGRDTDKDIKLNNVTIPAGTSVIVHVWALNRNAAYWGADAEEFKPERWLNPHTVPDHPAAFASFSPGRRNCIGKSYGMMVMKTILVHLLKRFRFEGDHKQLQFQLNVLLKPFSGHLLKLELR